MKAPTTFEAFHATLGSLLRDQPAGTTADLTEFAVAYLTRQGAIQGVLLRDDETGDLDENYELEWGWLEWRAQLLAWCNAPRFSYRADLLSWLTTPAADTRTIERS